MSGSPNALIIGNGSSRQNFKYPDSNIRIYGCNAIYRDEPIIINELVAIDPAIQHEIYSSDYVKNKRCWFSNWNIISTSRDYKDLLQYVDPSNIIENKNNTSDRCIIAGLGDKFYITWLYEEDFVCDIGSVEASTGEVAIKLAIKHNHTNIFLLGFDGVGNIYRGTENYYNEDGPLKEWWTGHEKIYEENPDISFYRINCNMLKSNAPNCIYINDMEFLDMI
jgi:hypothetical protein